MMINQTLNHNCVNRAGVRDKGSAHGSVSVSLSIARPLPNNQGITIMICSDLVAGMCWYPAWKSRRNSMNLKSKERLTSVVYKKHHSEDHEQEQQQGRIPSTNSSGLVMKPEIMVLKSLLQRNTMKRCLK